LDKTDGFNFYDYLFLRRVNSAIMTCGDQNIMQPNQLYCALAITSPRTRHLSPPEEREIYNAAIILTSGFYYG